MLWFAALFFVVVILAGTSLAVSRDSRANVASGHPTFESVADITGIWNRQQLDDLLGPRDDADRYAVEPDTVAKLPRTWWKRWFDTDVIDVGCIVAAIVAAILLGCSYSVAAWCILSAAATYVVAGYVGGVVVYMRSRT